MQRRREPARPVTPPTTEARPALMAAGEAAAGRHCGAPAGRDTGHRSSRSCAVFDDGTTTPVVAAPTPQTPVHGRRFFPHSGRRICAAAVGPHSKGRRLSTPSAEPPTWLPVRFFRSTARHSDRGASREASHRHDPGLETRRPASRPPLQRRSFSRNPGPLGAAPPTNRRARPRRPRIHERRWSMIRHPHGSGRDA